MDSPNVIYISGISPRSGTNYLHTLLSRHPACAPVADGEDYFFFKLDFLRLFVGAVYTKWDDDWELKRVSTEGDLYAALGCGLTEFLATHTDPEREATSESIETVLTKTPHPRNIHFFPSLFETGRLIILIRDGRAVTESSMRTFDDSFDSAALGWRDGARKVLRFVDEYGWRSDWHRIVKYETLVEETAGTVQSLCETTGLFPSDYPFESLEDTEVIGSSTFGKNDNVTWEPKEDDGSFDPLSRFASWEDSQHRRFEWLAGDELRALGYEADSPSFSLVSRLRNRGRDVIGLPRRIRRAARRKLKAALFQRVVGRRD
jgi:hypothetical protein